VAVVAALVGVADAFPGAGAAPAGKAAATQPTNTVKERYDRVLQEVKIPPDKVDEVRKILDDNYKALMEWVAKVDPEVVKLRTQMRAVHGSNDPKTLEQVQAAMKRYRELQKEMAGKISEVFGPLGKILPADQVEAVRKILLPETAVRVKKTAPDNPFHMLTGLNLTQPQISQISQIMDEARAGMKGKTAGDANSPSAMAEMANFESKAWQRIIKEVLTPEQRKKLEAARTEAAHRRMALAILGGIELTPDQQDKVDAIWKKAYEDATKKPDKRMDIYSDAQDKIIDEVLTDRQREQLKENRRGAPHPIPPGM